MGSLTDALKKAEQEKAEGADGLIVSSDARESEASSVSDPAEPEAALSGSVPDSPGVPTAPITADAKPPPSVASDAVPDTCDSTPITPPPTTSAAESESAAAASDQLVDVISELEARLADLPAATTADRPATVDSLPDAESMILVPTYHGPAVDPPSAVAPPHGEVGDTADDSKCVLDEELAEPYRVVRRRLIERLPQERHLVVAVVGGEQPGEAGSGPGWSVKSVAALNLGSVLAEIKGTTALVVEANFSSRSISRLLGISEDTPGLADVLRGEAAVEKIIHRSLVGHLDVISAGRAKSERPGDPLATAVGVELIAQLRDRYDFVLVDAAPSPSAGALEVYHDLYSGVLVVTTADTVDQRRAKVLVDRLEKHDVRVFGCILATPDDGSSEEAA